VRIGQPQQDIEFYYGTPGEQIQASVDNNYGGSFQWTQICAELMRRHATNGGGFWERIAGTGLDTQVMLSNTLLFEDIPGLPLPATGYDQASASHDFQLWLLWKPPGSQSIYIPLILVTWGWRGEAIISVGHGY
jgi:hypothetical protein